MKTSLLLLITFLSIKINANTIYGTLSNDSIYISINFNYLDSIINQTAIDSGFASGNLVSYEIVNETLYGYSFKYVYQLLDQNGDAIKLNTGIPLILVGNNFEEDPSGVNGGRLVTTCVGVNCPGGCLLD